MLLLPFPLAYQIKKEAQQKTPNEICGFVAGQILEDGRRTATAVYPVPNQLASPTRYQMAPQAQLQALFTMQHHQLDLLAIYHSHPRSMAVPSPTDLAEITYPQAWLLILGLDGFRLFEATGQEIPLHIDPF